MTRYSAETLDLSRVGAPHLTTIDSESLLRDILRQFLLFWDRARTADPSLPSFEFIQPDGTPLLETDPVVVLGEETAYAETLVLRALNDHANALRLGTALGADLDHLALTYKNTPRLLTASGVPIADDEYRELAQLSDEARPLFGITPGGYIWRVRRTFGDRVRDVRALRRTGGRIDLIVLARAGDGTPTETLIGDIQAAFDGEAGAASTDIVTVRPAHIVRTAVQVKLWVPRGPDPAVAVAAASKAIAVLAADRHRIGDTLHRQAIGAVAKCGPVRHVDIIHPSDDVVGGEDGAPYISSITVGWEVDA